MDLAMRDSYKGKMTNKSYQTARLTEPYTLHAHDRCGGWHPRGCSVEDGDGEHVTAWEVHFLGVPVTDIAELSKALDVRHALNFTSHAHFQKIEVKLSQFLMLVPRRLGKH